MRLSVNESYFRQSPIKKRTQLDTLKLIKDGGFDTVDFGLFNLKKHSDEGDDHRAWISKRREYCESIGLKVNQTHAPFYEGKPMPESYKERLLQCVEDTAALGADCMVAHGDTWYCEKYNQWDYSSVVNEVYEVFAPAVELAAGLGIKIAMETLHEWLGNHYHRVRLCSFVEEIDDLLDRFNCDAVGVCWDFGHAALVYKEDQFKALKRLRHPIIATHVHDNYFRNDAHSLPFQGSINWHEAMRTLVEIGYRGDLTLELGHGAIPDGLINDFISYTHKTGMELLDIFNSFSQ
ncbi:MAG: sugar phosphate isomerase/epimerase [Ruminococcaceae bacterium]|nr:sugar phosphate isomerase/epimerase [Oscillospiraceae bacterium]